MLILGSGPNRIGQGIEFDYSCVHAAEALREAGYETVMVNCNPETVSTDYDTSDRLYFEPLTLEDVLEVVHAERGVGHGRRGHLHPRRADAARAGAAAQGRRGADPRHPAGGDPPGRGPRTSSARCSPSAGLPAPRHGDGVLVRRGQGVAAEIGYPVLVRPSYVLGGRGMEIVYDESALQSYLVRHLAEIGAVDRTEHPILVDRFLDDAVEIDVDALYDGERALPRRRDGAHRGGRHPLRRLGLRAAADHARRDRHRRGPARHRGAGHARIGVRGLLNVQYALKDGVLYVLEANPRASRTVPFVSKATAVPLAKAAARIALGATVAELRAEGLLPADGDGGDLPADAPVAVKEAVLPFHRFRDAGRVRGGHRARAGDALHRRGDGHGRRVRHRVREVAGGRVRVAADQRAGRSSRSPTGTSGRRSCR